jgi:hypothetical protein
LKQRINIFNNVKDENNTLKKEKAEAERLVAQQKKVIERLQVNSGADKENACLLAKIDHEERLQVLSFARVAPMCGDGLRVSMYSSACGTCRILSEGLCLS